MPMSEPPSSLLPQQTKILAEHMTQKYNISIPWSPEKTQSENIKQTSP